MLETSEILSLEKRWKHYKINYYGKKVLLILIFISAIPLAQLTYYYTLSEDEGVTTKEIEQNQTNLNGTILSSQEELQKYKILNKNLEEEISSIKQEFKKVQQPQKPIISQQTNKNQKPFLVEESIDEEFLEANLVSIEPYDEDENLIFQEPRIHIETSELKGFEDLKEKFYETKNIIFALMLAEEYYHNKDYKNSLKWSLISNEINPQNERSWIIFAKSKAKTGEAKKAIIALEAYLKTNPNTQEIKTIIQKIKHGDY